MADRNTGKGIHSMVPREEMCEPARRLRDAYAITPGAPLIRKEFGYYCMERWKEQGMPEDVPLAELFDYDPSGSHSLGQLGWCEAALQPSFEVKVIEDRGEHELVQDHAGRHVLFFKGRRNGFMPEYVDHPVKDMKTWEENVKWRMDPASPERYSNLDERMKNVTEAAGTGMMIVQGLIGGYMYLRSLIGPQATPYAFYDMPDVIHDCMKRWLELAETVIIRHQEHVTIDELFLAEDICYNHGSLLSPDMMREFLFPYYQQLIDNVRSRQLDKSRHLYIHIDTDGFVNPLIPVYQELGADTFSPFEVASNCDVVEVGKQFPNLVIKGGIDKRVLAKSKDDIDRMVEYILPTMRARGGYIPTCDHGVPEEVSYENYLYYRKRCVELGG
ncbi:MAG: uroporphyrinogen decarboxylase family protein [Planctomycetota bacterium]|jgi:uroporphyrinogen decarboxylase|nr:uroporphyrinogen decarboxylase family protein [Planctomycetota bacterium]